MMSILGKKEVIFSVSAEEQLPVATQLSAKIMKMLINKQRRLFAGCITVHLVSTMRGCVRK